MFLKSYIFLHKTQEINRISKVEKEKYKYDVTLFQC